MGGCDNNRVQTQRDEELAPYFLPHNARLQEDDLRRATTIIFVMDDGETGSEENRNDDSDMSQLAKMPSLRRLTIACSQVTSQGFGALKDSQLEALIATKTNIGDDAVLQLANSKALKLLMLGETHVTNNSVEFIAEHFPALEKLELSETSVDDKAVPFLATLQHLAELDLSNANVTDASVPALSKMTQLKTLNVSCVPSDETSISSDGAKRLRGALPNTDVIHW